MVRKVAVAALAALLLGCAANAGEILQKIVIPNGLAHARVGDWITFKMADGTRQKHTVIERTGDSPGGEIVVQVETYTPSNSLSGTSRMRQPIGPDMVEPPVPPGESHSYERRKETINFEGTQLEITVINVRNNGSIQRIWYLSPELPVYGTIKKTFADGRSEFEVVDFGFAAQ